MKIYTKKDLQQAGCNLEPLECPNCKKTKNTSYNQYGKFCTCEDCGFDW